MQKQIQHQIDDDPSFLSKTGTTLWNWPATLRWMEPLPIASRRTIFMILGIMLIVAVYPDKQTLTNSSSRSSVLQNGQVTENPQRIKNPVSWYRVLVPTNQKLYQVVSYNFSVTKNNIKDLQQLEESDPLFHQLSPTVPVKVEFSPKYDIRSIIVELGDSQAFFIRQPDGSFYRYQ